MGRPLLKDLLNDVLDPKWRGRPEGVPRPKVGPQAGPAPGATTLQAREVEVRNGSGSAAVNIQDGGNSITVDGTFWQATQPVSAASLPLPTGAATAALQTQPGVDIGDVTVNNASGVSAVNIQDGGNSITVDGTFWQATQPVSAASLPLPSGASTEATLGSVKTAVEVMDDWDESDRAKVNPIVGQAGVQGGSGVVTALTQRVVLATDVSPPLPSGAATSANQYAQRPSEKSGRTNVYASSINLTADATVYTVTAGKTLYITFLELQGFSTGTTAGQASVRAGAAGARIVSAVNAPQSVTSVEAASLFRVGGAFLEPVPVAAGTAITFDEEAGTVTAAVNLVGYEE